MILIPLFFVFSIAASAQAVLRGSVNNEQQAPLRGATVQLLNTGLSTGTDGEGKFTLPLPAAGRYMLSVSHTGYATAIRQVSFDDSAAEVTVVLSPAGRQLGEVTVTAQKKDELLQNIPLSVTALTATQVAAYRLWSLDELTAIAPNLYLANPGDRRNVTALRGVVTTAYDPAVATYIDGVNQFNLDTYIPQLFDVERIEVARGPQGTLYGRNAMGGVINIITRQPQNRLRGFAEVSYGNYSQKRIAAGVQAPLVKDRLFFGIAGLYEGRQGFYTNTFTHSDYDRQHSIAGNYFLRYKSKTNWDLSLNVKHAGNRNKGAFPLVMGVDAAFQEPFVLDQNAVTEMVDNTLNASLAIRHAGPAMTFSAQTAWQRNYRYYTAPIDADFSPLDALAIFNNYGKDWNNVNVWTQEFRFSAAPDERRRWDWNAGAYLFYGRSPVKQATRFGADALPLGMPDKNFSIINTTTAENSGAALYGQATLRLTERLSLTGGLRYDYEHDRQRILGEYQKDPNPVPLYAFRTDTAGAASFGAFSPMASLVYRPHAAHALFVTYSQGFRAGGLTPLSSDPAQPPLYAFRPEKSYNIDLGVKNSFFNKRLTLNGSIFYAKVSDVQVPTLVLPEAITITRNTGSLTTFGAELEAAAVLKGFELAYSLGYTHAVYDDLQKAENNTVANLQGNRQIFTPDLTSMLAAQYTLALNRQGSIRLLAGGEWRYLGSQYFDLANTIRQQPYSLFHAKVGIEGKSASLLLWGRNLADARYISYAYDFGAVHLGDPRTYGATVSYRF